MVRYLGLLTALAVGCGGRPAPAGRAPGTAAPSVPTGPSSAPPASAPAAATRPAPTVTASAPPTWPLPRDCAAAPDSDACAWQRDDRAGLGDRVLGTDAARAHAALESRRAKVRACVASASLDVPHGREIRRRVRLRATFGHDGRIERALFQTQAFGYTLIDKFSYICIVNALGPLRLRPQPPHAKAVVTHTFRFGDEAGARP